MGCPVMHFEIGGRDSAKSAQFYGDLFGWKTQSFSGVEMIDTQGEGGIQGHFNALGHEPHNYVLVYVHVDEIESYLKKAESLGGTTLIPATEVPGAGHFAWFRDPDGNTIGLWKSAG